MRLSARVAWRGRGEKKSTREVVDDPQAGQGRGEEGTRERQVQLAPHRVAMHLGGVCVGMLAAAPAPRPGPQPCHAAPAFSEPARLVRDGNLDMAQMDERRTSGLPLATDGPWHPRHGSQGVLRRLVA